jgi:hypothetical protein
MTTYTRTPQRFDEQVCYPHNLPRPDLHKVNRSPPVTGPLQITFALSCRPDNRRSFPGKKRQSASVQRV